MANYPSYPSAVEIGKYGSRKQYTLTPEGYYVPAESYVHGEVPSYSNFGDLYGQQAQSMYDPVYAPIEKQATSYWDTRKGVLQEDLKNEYQKRGILNSGLYGQSVNQQFGAGGEYETARNAALSNIQMQKLGAVQGSVTNQLANQQTGQTAYYDRKQKEKEMALEERKIALQEAMLNATPASSGSSSSSGGSSGGYYSSGTTTKAKTQAQKDTETKQSLLQDITDSLSAWVRAGKPAQYTENSLIPALMQKYGMTIGQIANYVYPIRKQAAYGGE